MRSNSWQPQRAPLDESGKFSTVGKAWVKTPRFRSCAFQLWAHRLHDPRHPAKVPGVYKEFKKKSVVPLSDVLYNLSTGVKRLFGHVHGGELGALLAKAEREIPTAPAPRRKLSSPQIEQLVLDYKAGVGSVYVLARNYGVDRSTVSGHLRAAGLKLGRLQLTDAEVGRAAQLRADGTSFNAIGRAMKRDPKTIKKALA